MPDLVNDEHPFGSLQFNILKVDNALLELDRGKDLGPSLGNLGNYASAFALLLQQVIGNVCLPRYIPMT
jgi:hypothetical protein